MKELIKNLPIFEKVKSSDIAAATVTNIIAGFLGLLASRATVEGVLVPFGISMLAATPYSFIPSVAIGTFLGYFIPAVSGGGFRYVAALLAILAIRLLLSGYKSVSSSPVFICLIAFLSLAVTAPVSPKSISVPLLAAETLLGAGGAFFFRTVLKIIGRRKAGFSLEEISAFLIAIAVWTAGLGKINLFDVYFYRIICVFLVLCAAKYGGQVISLAAGAAAAICVFFVSRDFPVCLIMVVLGLCAGIFRIYGKLVMSLVTVAGALVGMMLTDNTLHPAFLAETLLACAVFFVMPKGVGAEIGKLLCVYPRLTVQSDLKKMVKLKLLDAADALLDVKNTVTEVSNRLSIITSPDFSGMIKEIEGSSCAGCKLRLHCWETRKGQTVDALMAVIGAKKRGEKLPSDFAGEEFSARCIKSGSFFENALAVYEKYAKSLAAENRAREVREVVSEQFDGISLLLKETANDISSAERFDRGVAAAAAAALKELDIFASEAVCRIDKFGRKFIKIKATANADTVVNKMRVMKALTVALECDFSVPAVTQNGNDLFISVSEAPQYKVETGAYQITANGGSMCGDSYKFLTDSHGRFFMILSDGMGTGGAAAVDSALSSGLVTRLIKSGINLDSAIKIINSSMLFKSTYESTATLDVACIDLYSGKTSIYKAGAAPSLIKKSGRVGSFTGKSLPIGILSDVHFEKATVNLKGRDIVLMMSDGVTGEGIEWIKRELENCGDINAGSLAECVALAARRRRSDGHEDDITVISAIVEKAV